MSVRTLHLTNAYHPSSGGIRTFYHALLRAAEDRERELVLVVPGASDDMARVGRYGRIYSIQAPASPVFDTRYRLILPNAYLPVSRSRLARVLEEVRPDVVEVCDKYGLFYLAAMLRKGWLPRVPRPTLIGLSCERMDDNVASFVSRSSLARTLSRLYIRHLYGPPFDFHVANSEYTAAELRAALSDRAADFVQVCPMGVDAAFFSSAYRDARYRRELLEQAGGNDSSVLLFYAGRLSPEKNLGLLVDTLERLALSTGRPPTRDYRLVLAGDGPQARHLIADAGKRVPGRVLWVGSFGDRAQLARAYASADVFVHPNPREPFGIGPLEAMASGVPVVLPRAGGVLSYASDRNSWLAPPDPDAFAASVGDAVERPDATRLAAARATAGAHAWEQVAGQYFDLYDRLAARMGGQLSRLPRAIAPIPQAASAE